jgi:hypothetical protein
VDFEIAIMPVTFADLNPHNDAQDRLRVIGGRRSWLHATTTVSK